MLPTTFRFFINRTFFYLCLLLSVAMLSGCGHKGELMLPEENPPSSTDES